MTIGNKITNVMKELFYVETKTKLYDMDETSEAPSRQELLAFLIFCLLEPLRKVHRLGPRYYLAKVVSHLEHRLRCFANLLADVLVNILLADMSTPLNNDILLQHIILVELHEDLGHERDQLRVIDTNKALQAAKK